MSSNQENQDTLDLQQYLLILKRRWVLIVVVTGSVFGLSALLAFRQKPIYEAEGKLLFNKTDRVSSLTNPSQQVVELSSVTQQNNPLDTEAEIIRSSPIIKNTITTLSLTDNKGIPMEIGQLLTKLKVKSVRGTDILSVSYTSRDPKEAADVVNSVMKYYLVNNISVNQAQARAASRFLSNQLPQVEARVVRAEAALRQFKEQSKVVALDQEAATSVERLNELSGQITQAQSNLVDAETRSQLLQRQLKLNSQQAVDTGNLSQSKAVQEVLTQYQKTQNELTVAQTLYTNEHPVIVNLMAKATSLKKQLATRVSENGGIEKSVPTQNLQMGELKQTLTAQLVQSDVERSALANRIKVLQDAYTISQQRLGVLPKLQEKQQQLERQLQVARGTYEELLKRSQEVEVVVNQNIGNARVVSEAIVPNKAASKIKPHLALGGLLGFFLGVGIALMLEAMDRSLKTIERVQQLFGYSLLGTIPQFGQKSKSSDAESLVELPVRDNLYSTANSAFEMLQTNLDFTVFDKQLRVIAVVSSTPGEGRSFVAANLAVAKAHMGRRVLLIDGDMRHSCQQAIWKLPNLVGLSNVLVGQAEFSRTTQEVLVNLNVLTVGTIPPNVAALLDSQRMSLLIQEAIESYDCVIIDTPALSLFGDALILSKMADGILLVVRPGVLHSSVAKTAKTMLEQARSRVLGMVVNGVTTESRSGYYYHSRRSDREKIASSIKI
ncbi:polysaccharide biosynthesis tyrosine autokinase [Aetokthonos hydrillicola Thurmond2011]|jgi:capsular exopolysaccharide synthesis family protein|uniref:Polysaccharide biosynthesis tyrosine autokinase n=1 Tax=Aetokthonos hydrillicola Thurmond2011 TaxID=2712845 RepID=A0AAP5IBW1_9CYAN|nr:polysaccharide biosynthesis tyrosine autokinase [Aetokthonos hydrillicola]MBO3463340.1 polysaccharide biosynthesis tyrosine autokinase [Aetokthonos hydrillicola CCALA 1050]MBW4589187.1 polysaccharide biosynthesis tyrosine autokinase [Aetokthonos hydrillicola CCALA 1050]MDR9898747.1 polysaccharide biosynthesis tyrosine autokinase [Aetokthonos hydrillicola Thurmond2011]